MSSISLQSSVFVLNSDEKNESFSVDVESLCAGWQLG